MPGDRRFATSLGASALLHLLLLSALFLYVTMPHRPSPLPTVDVDLSSLPLPAPVRPAPAPPKQVAKAEPAPPAVAVPKQQIVEPPDKGEEKEPPNTNLLSDRNNLVPEEMVRHGDHGTDENATESHPSHKGGGAAPQEPPKVAAPPAPAAPERPKPQPRPAPPAAAAPQERPRSAPAAREAGDEAQRLASLPSLDKLLPNAADLAQRQPLPRATPEAPRTGRDLLNSGGQVFSGRPGTRDYLPQIRQGNVTMLNTKADLFAPFVRRVAGRVFENLDLAFSSMRYGRGVGTGRALATVEAIMDRKGRFVSAKLLEQSGVNAVGVDRMLLGAATPDTFFDANPPSGAEATDGNIHFILLVDLTVDLVGDPRTGREAVNYYGIAGVGLK